MGTSAGLSLQWRRNMRDKGVRSDYIERAFKKDRDTWRNKLDEARRCSAWRAREVDEARQAGVGRLLAEGRITKEQALAILEGRS